MPPYGRHVETMRLAADAPGHDDENLPLSQQPRRDARGDLVVLTSSFTPINRPNNTSSAPCPPHASATRSGSHGDAPDSTHKRNPIVAEYLGLGQQPEASKFSLHVQEAFWASGKRRRTSGDALPRRRAKSKTTNTSNVKSAQRCISDGMRATKSGTQPANSLSKSPKAVQVPDDPIAASGSSNQIVLSDVTIGKLNAFKFQAVNSTAEVFKEAQLQDENAPTSNQITSSDFDRCLEEFEYDYVTDLANTDNRSDYCAEGNVCPRKNQSIALSEAVSAAAIYTETSNKQPQSIKFSSDDFDVSDMQNHSLTSSTDPGTCTFVPIQDTSDNDSFFDWTAEELAGLQGVDLETLSEPANTDHIAYMTNDPRASAARDVSEFADDFDMADDGLSDNDLLQLEEPHSETSKSHNHNLMASPSTAKGKGVIVHEDDENPISEANVDDWSFLDDQDFFAADELHDSLLEPASNDPFNQLVQVMAVSTSIGNSTSAGGKDRVTLLKHSMPDRTLHVAAEGRQPIVRSPFPAQVRDRSPIIGLSADMQLRTCFRIGEALNVGYNAVRQGKTVIIELYARVLSSWREEEGMKQQFVFIDLFHNHPPFLEGSYELWKDVELWDYDSGRFLHDPSKMCRCIGKMKRDGKTWKLTILNIWEASWDDIDFAKGIVCA